MKLIISFSALVVFSLNMYAQPSFIGEPSVTSANASSIDLTYELDIVATVHYVIYNNGEIDGLPDAEDVNGADGVFDDANQLLGSGSFSYAEGELGSAISKNISDDALSDFIDFDVFIVAEDAEGFSVVKDFRDQETNRPNVNIIEGGIASPVCKEGGFLTLSDITIQELDKRNFSVGDVDEVFLFSII